MINNRQIQKIHTNIKWIKSYPSTGVNNNEFVEPGYFNFSYLLLSENL